MDDSGPPPDDWIQQWIEQQRSLLRERSSQQRNAAGAAEEMQRQVQELGSKWLEVGEAYLHGLRQFTQALPADSLAAATSAGGAFKLGEEFLSAWHGHWQSLAKTPSQPDAAGVWSDVLRQLPPIGMAREHNAALRELAQAHAECQRLEQALRTMLYGVQADALNLLERRVRERPGEQAKLGFRDLYDLWVECGEQVYAQVAHSEAYCQLQAQLGNATMLLRARQQKLIEHALKQFDLPTRSELNSVHRQLRDQARQLRELQAQLAAAQSATVQSSVEGARPAARARGKGKNA